MRSRRTTETGAAGTIGSGVCDVECQVDRASFRAFIPVCRSSFWKSMDFSGSVRKHAYIQAFTRDHSVRRVLAHESQPPMLVRRQTPGDVEVTHVVTLRFARRPCG